MLINAIESFRILNSNTEFLPKFFIGCIRWQVEPIETEIKHKTKQLQPAIM